MATEIDANPSLVRDPEARHKTRNRSGQKGGASKAQIPGPFSWRTITMQESYAYRVLSLSALRVMSRLEIELARHGGKPEENGNLACTFDDFVEHGIDRNAIAPAIRELVALGFIEITRKGSAGNAGWRQPQRYSLTYRHAGSNQIIKDGWKRILSLDEAERIADKARSKQSSNRAAREFGRKGAVTRWAKKQKPSHGNHTDPSHGFHTDGAPPSHGFHTDGPVMGSIPLSIISLGGDTDAPTAPVTPPDALHALLGKLPWSPPRWVEITLEMDRALNRHIDASTHRLAPIDALTAIEGLILSSGKSRNWLKTKNPNFVRT